VTLYHNTSDIGNNKKKTSRRSDEAILQIRGHLDYFGFCRLVFSKRTVAAYTMKSSKQLKRIYPKLLKARLDFYLTITVPSLKC